MRYLGLVISIPSQLSVSLLPIEFRSSYLRLFGDLFGHGPSLPELAATYWQNDVLAEPYREALNLTTELFPLGTRVSWLLQKLLTLR